MATNTSTGSGNVSDDSKWSLGHSPMAGEDVVIATGHLMALDITVFPPTGTLASLVATGGTGQLSVDMASLASATINIATLTAGTAVLVNVSGSAAGKTFSINVTTGTGGTGTNAYCLSSASTCHHETTGEFIAGSGTTAFGVRMTAGTWTHNGAAIRGGSGGAAFGAQISTAGAVNITLDNIVAGSALNSHGVVLEHAATNVTISVGTATGGTGLAYGILNNRQTAGQTFALTVGAMVDGVGGAAVAGRPPSSLVTTASFYHQLADGTKLFKRRGSLDGGIGE
jgi:hypothetical protein